MRRFWGGVVFLLMVLGGRAAWAAAVEIPLEELQSHGLVPPIFTVVTFSPDDRQVLGFEQASAEEVARGVTHKVFLLQLRSDGRLSGVRRYDLGIPSMEQEAFTPDGREVVIVTRSGATFVALDLDTGRVRTLMEHEPGQPGFRAHPPVLWQAGGRLLGLGYFYDAEDYGGENAIAAIDPAREGAAAFQHLADVEDVERSLKGLAFHAYTDGRTGFFGVKRGGRQEFLRWVAGSAPAVIDEAVEFTGFMAVGDRLAYGAKRQDGQYEMRLYDGATGAKQVLGTSREPYKYVFLSEDGSTVVAHHLDGDRMKVLSASTRNGLKMQPVPDLPRARVGTVRLTSDGRRMLLYNRDGLTLVDLP